jgi:hypothetical protein
MRAYAIAEFGLDYESACRLTLPMFFDIAKKAMQKEQRENDTMSALIRAQTFYLVNIQLDKKDRYSSVNDLWPLSFEGENYVKPLTKEDMSEGAKLLGESFTVGE